MFYNKPMVHYKLNKKLTEKFRKLHMQRLSQMSLLNAKEHIKRDNQSPNENYHQKAVSFFCEL